MCITLDEYNLLREGKEILGAHVGDFSKIEEEVFLKLEKFFRK